MAMNLSSVARIFPFLGTFLQPVKAVGLPTMMASAFKECNITIAVQGETTGWNAPGKAALLFGSHSRGFEPVVLMALAGSLHRYDFRVIAIPNIGSSKLFELLDSRHGSNFTLPVLPGLLAKERKHIWNHFFFYRLFHYRTLPTRAALKEANLRTLSKAAQLLEAGSMVTIFPTGSRSGNTFGRWHCGIGEIISHLSTASRANVLLVPFLFENNYANHRLAKAFAERCLGRVPRQQSFTLRLGHQGSCLDLLGQETDPQAITEVLRKQYRESFFYA